MNDYENEAIESLKSINNSIENGIRISFQDANDLCQYGYLTSEELQAYAKLLANRVKATIKLAYGLKEQEHEQGLPSNVL